MSPNLGKSPISPSRPVTEFLRRRGARRGTGCARTKHLKNMEQREATPGAPEPVTAVVEPSRVRLTHLQRLESEAIHIMREVVAECRRPVMLYSIGKDSSVMLHIAMKAFHPGPPPFPLLHVDTTWKFREMISFRDKIASTLGLELIV